MWKPVILDVECIVCNKSLQKINHLPRDCNKMGKIIKVNNNRRLRTPNWSLEEKQYLLELIKQRKDVVVTKSNNGPNHYEEKDVAWNEILHELAAKFGDKFKGNSISIKKVKTQWQNMKRIARDEMALNGQTLQNYSRLSLEVCNIIEAIKDGILRNENESFSESTITTNIEIKTECVEEDVSQPSCSGTNPTFTSVDTQFNIRNNSSNITVDQLDSSISSISDSNDFETLKEDNLNNNKRNASAMTENIRLDETNKVLNPFHRELQQYFQYTAEEKKLKMESLKEERQVIRAMRETAELNKIIAEQKLKHVLWIKKQEMLYV